MDRKQMTDAQEHGRAAFVHGWISNGGASDETGPVRECIYRLPGTPAYANVVYALNGVMLWGKGNPAPVSACTFGDWQR